MVFRVQLYDQLIFSLTVNHVIQTYRTPYKVVIKLNLTIMWKLNYKDRNNGFTLIELLVTMGIIAVLAGIAVVSIGKIKGTTRQTTCVNNLRSISQGLQLYYNDFRIFPDDGYPDDANDTMPLSTELTGYIKDKSTFLCPEDNDTTSTGNFASYDPYYVSRKASYGTDELAIGCPRHRGADNSTSLFSSGSTEITKIGTVLANGQEIPPDGTKAQRTISSGSDVMTFSDGSTVTISNVQAGYGVFLLQSVVLADGTIYSLIRVENDGTINVQVSSGSKFEIVTPSALVGVRGTQFTVTTTNLGFTTDVSLTDGTVVLMNRATGKTTTLTGVDAGTVNMPTHSHLHYHIDGTSHTPSHIAQNNAHHGHHVAAIKAAAAAADPDDVDDDSDGYTENQGDCNDADSSVNPGATEIFDNGIDDDCNPATLDNFADPVLVDLINMSPPVESSDLKSALLAASPLSSTVLTAAIDRSPNMNSSDLKEVLRNESALTDTVIIAAIDRTTPMDSCDLKDVLVNESPLATEVLQAAIVRDPAMEPNDLQAVLDAQGQ